MFNRKTDYARNKKDRTAIVYCDADGKITRLTREDFSSLEEFFKWKAWSDASYHIIEKADHIYGNNNISLSGLSEAAAAVPSPEEAMTQRLDAQEREALCRLLALALESCLTETQRSRLWSYVIGEKSLAEIAAADSRTHQAISKSIADAKEKLKKFLK